ncbi:hypothetical protein D3C86_2258120 [compost metagenome]
MYTNDHRYGCSDTGPRRAASIHGMNWAMNRPTAMITYINRLASSAAPRRPSR